MFKKFITKYFLIRKLKKDRNKYPFWENVISSKHSKFLFKKIIEQCIELDIKNIHAKLYFFSHIDLKSNKKKIALVIKIFGKIKNYEIKIKTTHININEISTYWVVLDEEKKIISKFYTKSVNFVESVKVLI